MPKRPYLDCTIYWKSIVKIDQYGIRIKPSEKNVCYSDKEAIEAMVAMINQRDSWHESKISGSPWCIYNHRQYKGVLRIWANGLVAFEGTELKGSPQEMLEQAIRIAKECA